MKKKSVFNNKGKIISNSTLMSYGESLKKQFFLFFILLISMLTLPTLANIMIDDFSVAQSVGSNLSSFATDAGILGGERHVETNSYAFVEINTSVPNQAVLDSTPGVAFYAYVNLSYDGIGSNPYGLNNMDLTDGGKYSGFQLSVMKLVTAVVTFILQLDRRIKPLQSVLHYHRPTLFFYSFQILN